MPSYFNTLECGRNILGRLDVTYERARMDTPKEKYYTTLLETLVDDNNRNGALLSNEKLRQAVSKVMEETEAEFECCDKITMDTLFQSPVQMKDISTINDSPYYDSDDQVDTISDSKRQVDPSSDARVDTHITDGIRKLPIRPITLGPVVIGQDLVTSVRETSCEGLLLKILKPLHTISLKEIVMDVACNSTQVYRIAVWNPIRAIHRTPGVNVFIFSPIRGSNSSFEKWLSNIEPLNTSIDGSAAQERNSNCFCNENGCEKYPR